ncbi:MAG: response regulator transcription factor [Chloroflexi bacterium]|nr:response regulator transcription factor [Chloroflexota bacterium]
MSRIQVLLVDDHLLVRHGLRTVLATDPRIEVVGEASTSEEAVRLALELRPQVILMDIRLPGPDGLRATREIKVRLPSANVIILTAYDHDEYVLQALEAGAVGYLAKDSSAELIIQSIHSAVEGGVLVKRSSAQRPGIALLSRQRGDESMVAGKLTLRENQVLKLITDGASNKEIARALGLATITVKKHVQNLLTKLDVSDRTQAAVKALRTGLVELKAPTW